MGPLLFAQYSAKAIAAAVVVLVVALVRIKWPDVAQTEVQEALRTLVEISVTAGVVWLTPNKTLPTDAKETKED